MLKTIIKSRKTHFILFLVFILSIQFGHAQKLSYFFPILTPSPSLSGYCGVLDSPESCTLTEHFVLNELANFVHDPKFEFIDRFGNVNCKKIPLKKSKQIKIKGELLLQSFGPVIPQPIVPNYISPEGLFAVYLTNDSQSPPAPGIGFSSNTAARNVVAQIFADLEKLIIETVPSGDVIEPVKFELKSSFFNSDMLGSASSYYDYNDVPSGTIINGCVWNAINSGSNAADEWDGVIRVNFFHPWRTQINPTFPGFGYDMYSVLLHEIMHALGFASGIGINGLPKNNISYLPYDQLIHTNTGVALVDQSGDFNTPLLSTITTGCPNAGVLRLGEDNRNVYSPDSFSLGSSLSHIDLGNNCSFPTSDYIMTPQAAINSPKRLHADEFGLLCELGYSLSSSFGHQNVIIFSNPATVIGASNSSNLLSYSGCTPSVVGIDDFDNLANVLSSDNCIGVTVQILESDLLANDNSTLGLPLQVANLIALDGSAITFTNTAPNRIFTYTPSSPGNIQLRYQPLDNSGNYGNYTYVNIHITSCSGLGCVNTNTCNLICNPEVIDNGNCGIDECIYFQFSAPFSNCSSTDNFNVPGWTNLFFSPDWLPDVNFTSCTNGTSAFFNTNLLPNPSGGRISFFSSQRATPSNSTNTFTSEAASTSVNIQPNKNYILSYHKIDGIDFSLTSSPNIVPAIGLKVGLNIIDDVNLPTTDLLKYRHNRIVGTVTNGTSQSNQFFNNTNVELITDMSISSNWSQTVLNFTSPNNAQYSLLSFYGLVDESYLNTVNSYINPQYSSQSEISVYQFDRFELIEDHLQDIPNEYIVDCGVSTSVGIELCSVANMQFQWWDVTNNIQLTNANTILNTSPLGTYSVISTNANGSILEISNIYSDINLELRRVMPSLSNAGLAIFDNVPAMDNIKSVVVNVLGGDAPYDATFTATENSPNCFELTFQSTTLNNGETHQWDFQNDGTVDATGSSTSFNFQINGSYPVVHITSNDCGSRKDTMIVTVDCSICTWPKHYGSNSSLIEKADAVVVDNSGNVFAHGIVESSIVFEGGATVESGVFLAKYDNCGVLLWIKDVPLYGRTNSKMKIDNLGNPILMSTNATSGLDNDINYRLTKFSNSNGSVLWSNVIEQYRYLYMPSFDIDMNTNEIYLLTSVNVYTKVKQANGAYIIDYTAPNGPNTSLVYPKIKGHIVKFNSSGMVIWQDHMIANSGSAGFQDIVVAENTNRVYLAGFASDHPSPVGNITFNSNNSITMYPNDTYRLFIASYTTGGVLLYSNMYSSINANTNGIQLEYSNTDDEIYLKNGQELQLFNTAGNLISSTLILGQLGQMYYDQINNHLITCGTHFCNELKIQKYIGTTLVWTYLKGTCNSKAVAFQVSGDPTSDKIFVSGNYWANNFLFSPMVNMPLAGGHDAFIAKIRDLGSTVSYNKKEQSEEFIQKGLEDDIFSAEVFIYPNPSNGIFSLNLVSKEVGCRIEVFNYLGQVVYENIYDSNFFTIDLSLEPKGVYKVEINNVSFSSCKNIIIF